MNKERDYDSIDDHKFVLYISTPMESMESMKFSGGLPSDL